MIVYSNRGFPLFHPFDSIVRRPIRIYIIGFTKRMKNLAALSLLAALLFSATPAFSQNYHYSYGGSRVVNQGHTGLYMPAATQIGAGTISRSAQGYQQSGAIINPGLPPVPMGSHVTTAGDAQYQTGFAPGTGMPGAQQPRIVCPNVAGTAIWNAGLPGAPFGSHVGTPGDGIRSDLHPEINDRNQSWWHPQAQGGTYSVQQVRYAPSGASGAATYESQGGSSGALTY